jgi:hypothetical protein
MSAIFISIIATLIAAVVGSETKAWAPRLIHSLTKAAVAIMPIQLRERFFEEWSAHIDEMPGVVGRLLAAVGFVFAASRISANERVGRVFLRMGLYNVFYKAALRSALGELKKGPLLTRAPRAAKTFTNISSLGLMVMKLAQPAFSGTKPPIFAFNVMAGFAFAVASVFDKNQPGIPSSWNVDPETGNFIESQNPNTGAIRITAAEPFHGKLRS